MYIFPLSMMFRIGGRYKYYEQVGYKLNIFLHCVYYLAALLIGAVFLLCGAMLGTIHEQQPFISEYYSFQ